MRRCLDYVMKRATLLICLLAVLSASVLGSANGSGTAATVRLRGLDHQVLAQVNRTRVKHGLRRLVVSNELERASYAHSNQMLKLGFFDHDAPGGLPFPKRIRSFYPSDGFSTWSAGENLLYSTAEIAAGEAVQAWLNSPEHRENMLSPDWREVGVGSVRARVAGGTFGAKSAWVITMNFGARSGKTSS